MHDGMRDINPGNVGEAQSETKNVCEFRFESLLEFWIFDGLCSVYRILPYLNPA